MTSTTEAAFAAAVRERHGLEPLELVRRPELDGGGFLGFTAVTDGGNVRGLVSAGQVLTHADPGAFAAWLAAVDFAHIDAVDPVQLVHVFRSLQPPPQSRYEEDAFPLLYAQQLETAPVGHLAEPVELPRLVQDAGGRQVVVWFQCEPGSRFERWTFAIAGDNTFTVQRRAAQEAGSAEPGRQPASGSDMTQG